jgi:hypothetical protein
LLLDETLDEVQAIMNAQQYGNVSARSAQWMFSFLTGID